MSEAWLLVSGFAAVVYLLVKRQAERGAQEFREWQKKRHEDYLRRMADKLKNPPN